MKQIKHKVFTLLIFLLLITNLGCEGYRCGTGKIVDSKSDLPLDSVLCKIDNELFVYSDSIGHYELCGRFSGCVPDCPDIQIEFSKKGYKTQIIKNPNKDIIRLEKD